MVVANDSKHSTNPHVLKTYDIAASDSLRNNL
jgi:hypothetical protein